jgi:hypothetical protein
MRLFVASGTPVTPIGLFFAFGVQPIRMARCLFGHRPFLEHGHGHAAQFSVLLGRADIGCQF